MSVAIAVAFEQGGLAVGHQVRQGQHGLRGEHHLAVGRKHAVSIPQALTPENVLFSDVRITLFWVLWHTCATTCSNGSQTKMPRQPQWFQHVPQALEQLRELPAPAVDRAALEKLLHVSRRAAIRLLHRFGGYQAGRTFLIGREELAQALESVLADPAYQFESRRRHRLSDDLENTRRDLRARQVKLPVAPDPRPGSSLPSGLRIVRPGVLQVEFANGEELLGRLFELVRMAGEDLETFEDLVSRN